MSVRYHRNGDSCATPKTCDQKHYRANPLGTTMQPEPVQIPLNQGGHAAIPSVTLTQPAEAQCSVEIKEDSKGNTQISVKIYNDDIYTASMQAYAVYKLTRASLDSNELPDADVVRALKKGK